MKRFSLPAWLLLACIHAPAADIHTPPITGAVMKPVVRQPAPPPVPVFKARDFGAKGDSASDDTEALRKAIAACAGTGGSVLLENGTFLTGNLELKGGMTLYVAANAVLKGNGKPQDFPVILPRQIAGTAAWKACRRSLLFADGADKLRIDGGGVIDGNGQALAQAGMLGKEETRPSILRFFASKDVAVRNITLKNSHMWTQVYDDCENLVIEKEIVRCPPIAGNSDGMDICNCRHIVIRDNDIESEDDSICLKSHGPRGMSDVLIENNSIRNLGANAIKFGTSSAGDITDVRIFNNTVKQATFGGLCIESVDGAHVRNIHVKGLTLEDCQQPFFIRLSHRGSYWEIAPEFYPKEIGEITGVIIENAVVTPAAKPRASGGLPSCTVTGITAKNLGDILFKDIRITMPGGVAESPADPKENDKAYPQSSIFGRIPAYTFFVRHADKVRFENIKTGTLLPDTRPWLRSVNAQVETVNIEEERPN